MVHSGGQVVSELIFYSDHPNSNPTESYSFNSVKWFEKNENKRKNSYNTSLTHYKPFYSLCCYLSLPVWPDGPIIFQYLDICNTEN